MTMNRFTCPTIGCVQNTEPTFTTEPQIDNECGECGAHGPTVEVSE